MVKCHWITGLWMFSAWGGGEACLAPTKEDILSCYAGFRLKVGMTMGAVGMAAGAVR